MTAAKLTERSAEVAALTTDARSGHVSDSMRLQPQSAAPCSSVWPDFFGARLEDLQHVTLLEEFALLMHLGLP